MQSKIAVFGPHGTLLMASSTIREDLLFMGNSLTQYGQEMCSRVLAQHPVAESIALCGRTFTVKRYGNRAVLTLEENPSG